MTQVTLSHQTRISLSAVIAGIIFYALHHEWIVLRIMPRHSRKSAASTMEMQKKIVKLIFWHADAWHTEDVDSIWSHADTAHNIHYLINQWLTLLDEEKIM